MKIGEKRQFGFIKTVMVIAELLEDADVSMWWEWKSEVCPHCKEKIEKRLLHEFQTVEILVPESLKDEKVTLSDIMLIGHAKDGKTMLMTKDKFKEVLEKSKNFKYVVEKETK